MKSIAEIFIKEIVALQLEMNIDYVDMNENLINMGADSIDIIEIIDAIEERFDICIPNNECKRCKTPNDFVKYIIDLDDTK